MYSMGIKISDKVKLPLRRLTAALHQDKIRPIAGRAGVNVVRNHLFDVDKRPGSRHGGKRTHFYAKAARSTNYREVSNGVIVAINHTGIAQRFFGGTIEPTSGSYLTIPAAPEAYGRRAREFNNLEVAFGQDGPYALIERRATQLKYTKKGVAKGKESGGKIMFWLVGSVEQDPDPSVLPTEKKILSEVYKEVNSYIVRVVSK